MRHRVIAGLLSTGLAAAVLTGCNAISDKRADVSVSEEAGARPVVTLKGKPPRSVQIDVVRAGSGKAVKAEDIVIADIDIRVWKDNREYLSTWAEGGHPNSVIMDGTHVSRNWDKALVGKKAGSRVVLTSPASEGFGPNFLPPTGTAFTDTLVIVFDILGSYAPNAAAQGEQEAKGTAGPGLPAVEFDGSGTPRMTFHQASAPKKPTARTLIAGKGAKVRATDSVVVQFSHQAWGEPQPDQTSYTPRAPRSFSLDGDGIPDSWKEFVVGAQVGSRLVIAEPGDEENPGDKGGAYVIDIIDSVRHEAT